MNVNSKIRPKAGLWADFTTICTFLYFVTILLATTLSDVLLKNYPYVYKPNKIKTTTTAKTITCKRRQRKLPAFTPYYMFTAF